MRNKLILVNSLLLSLGVLAVFAQAPTTSIPPSPGLAVFDPTPIVAAFGPPECNSIYASGDHWLVENNDFSHYTLSVLLLTQFGVFRNNTFHDQYQAEAAGNSHTDTLFSEPGVSVNVQYNLYEGNTQRNAFGPDAKGVLSQGESCGGTCQVLIERFNVVSRIGGGDISNNTTWDAVKNYNNTKVDANSESSFACGNTTTDNSTPALPPTWTTTRSAYLNNIYFYSASAATTGCVNPYQLSTTQGSSGVWGNSLAYCSAGPCGTVYGHLYSKRDYSGERHYLGEQRSCVSLQGFQRKHSISFGIPRHRSLPVR